MLADLHNHSCLSPCATLEMSPSYLVASAAAKGIRLLGLTDHNSARNTPAFAEACQRNNITGLYGLEITTAEECHVLALFDTLDTAAEMDAWVMAALPKIPLNVDHYGDQPVVDFKEEILEMIPVLLISAISCSLERVEAKTHTLGGLFIPSHINRHAFSVESQLGFLPPGNYDAIEVMPGQAADYRRRYPALPVITASDAHCPQQIASAPFSFDPPDTTIDGIRRGLAALCP